jgi:hypothetical protein
VHGPARLVDEVAHPAAGGHLVLPLWVFGAAEGGRGEAPAEPVLAIRVAHGERVAAQRLVTAASVAGGLRAEVAPTLPALAGAAGSSGGAYLTDIVDDP